MPFVREKTPEEFKQKHPELCECTNFWLIDRERELIFIYTGGNPRGNQKSFVLFVEGEPIKIWSEYKQLGTGEKAVIEWNNTSFEVPEILAAHNEKINNYLAEAFQAHGLAGTNLQKKKKVTVNYQ